MLSNKYFALIFITLYDSIKSSNGQFPNMQYSNMQIENEKFDLQHPFGNETNFLIKAKLNYETIEGSANDFYIEESIFSDERNRIVTLINHEANPIEIFREFETQRISLVCFPLKHCYRNGDLRHYQFPSEYEMVTQIVKSALLMGPHRIISYFANETINKISRWIDTGNGSTQYMEMTAVFSDGYNKKLMGLKNALKITITGEQERNVTLYITQVEPFKKITITKLDGGRTSGLTESIGSRKNSFTITSVDSVSSIKISDGKFNDRELVYDYKFGMKYTLSGSNECAIELGDAPDKLILVNPDYYGSESYYPRIPVAPYSNKFMVKAEYNKVINNVNYDLVVATISRPSPDPISPTYSFYWFANLSIEQKLYSKYATNEESFQYDYIESRVISFSREIWIFDRNLNEIVNLNDRCFRERKEAIILNLKISLLDQSTSRKLHSAIGGIHGIKRNLRRLIMHKLKISILRINLIKFNFFHSNIMAKLEIFDSIVINFLSKRGVSHKFNIKSTESGQIHTSTIDECLHLKASKVNLSDVITCKTLGDYLCLGIAQGDSLPDEDNNGLDCTLFSNSDQRLSRLSGETPLKVIEKSYLNLNGSQFNNFFIELVVVDVTIGDGIRLDSPEKTKSNSTFAFFLIFSILINIVLFVKFALDYKLSQRRTRPLKDTVSIKLDNLNN